MQVILNQLSDLLLGSIPTVIFFLILLAAYAVLVRKPLEAVLAERAQPHRRCHGMKRTQPLARQNRRPPPTKPRLRDARGEIFAGAHGSAKSSWHGP